MDSIANFLFNRLVQPQYSELERTKLIFGIRVLLTNVITLLVVYTASILLGCVLETLITHVAFFLVRQVALGYHFKNIYECIAWSAIAFPVASKALTYLSLMDWIVYAVLAIAAVVIFTIAPCGTTKQPVVNEKHRLHLRKKLKIRLPLIVIAFIFVPSIFKPFLALGLTIQTILLLVQKYIMGR